MQIRFKNIFRHTVAYLLLLLFIGAGTGFTIYRHHCFSADKTQYSLTSDRNTCNAHQENPKEEKEEGCCKSPKEPAVVSHTHKSCCADSEFSRQLQIEEYIPVYFTEIPLLLSPVLLPEVCFVMPVAVSESDTQLPTPDHPPLRQGRDILAFTQILRI